MEICAKRVLDLNPSGFMELDAVEFRRGDEEAQAVVAGRAVARPAEMRSSPLTTVSASPFRAASLP